jgi:prevent-host-death family protein
MCYMAPKRIPRQIARLLEPTVGVRELRQNLSVYLDRVKAGQILRVTEHGQEVALLTPLPPKTMNVLERMVAEGKATAPTKSLKNLKVPKPGRPGLPRSEDILDELRQDRL